MLLICVATAIEAELLRRDLDDADRGIVAGRAVALLETGIGPVSAASAVALFLARNDLSGVVNCGIGGAYPGSGLEPTDVVCAESETFGDFGVETETRFLDFNTLGFGPAAFQLDLFPAEQRAPFVTVATCTGTERESASAREPDRRRRRVDGRCGRRPGGQHDGSAVRSGPRHLQHGRQAGSCQLARGGSSRGRTAGAADVARRTAVAGPL